MACATIGSFFTKQVYQDVQSIARHFRYFGSLVVQFGPIFEDQELVLFPALGLIEADYLNTDHMQ